MKKIFKSKLLLQVVVASMVATLATALIVSAATTIGANITTAGTLAVTGTSAFTGAVSFDGTASTTGSAILQSAIIDSTTGVISFSDANLTTTGNLAFATASSTGQVKVASLGIASTTPAAGFQLSIGTGASASSTISMGKFCMYAAQENGVGVYLRLGANQPANQPFATSTVPCN